MNLRMACNAKWLEEVEKMGRMCYKYRKCIYWNLETGQIYPKILVSYLDNPSKEATSESSQIKEQHEIIKVLNEEVTMLSAKTLSFQPQLSRPVHENFLISDKSFYTVHKITLKSWKFQVSYDKVWLLTGDLLSLEQEIVSKDFLEMFGSDIYKIWSKGELLMNLIELRLGFLVKDL